MTDASRPQPVVDLVGEATELATTVSAFVKSLGAVLVLVGFATDDTIAKVATISGLVIVTGGELVSYVYTRVELARAARKAAAQVTPLTDPKDDRGVNLVPVDAPVLAEKTTLQPAEEPVDDPGEHAAPELPG